MTATVFTFARPTVRLMSMNDRDHWRAHSRDVAAWRAASQFAARGWIFAYSAGRLARKPFPPAIVATTFDVPDKRRRDPHNYYPTVKAIVDGLVDAGLWPDDTPEWVTTAEPELRHAPGRRREMTVTVELRPR